MVSKLCEGFHIHSCNLHFESKNSAGTQAGSRGQLVTYMNSLTFVCKQLSLGYECCSFMLGTSKLLL
jgi:hypothetical protein